MVFQCDYGESVVRSLLQNFHEIGEFFDFAEVDHRFGHDVSALDLLGLVVVRVQFDLGHAPEVNQDVLDAHAEGISHPLAHDGHHHQWDAGGRTVGDFLEDHDYRQH